MGALPSQYWFHWPFNKDVEVLFKEFQDSTPSFPSSPNKKRSWIYSLSSVDRKTCIFIRSLNLYCHTVPGFLLMHRMLSTKPPRITKIITTIATMCPGSVMPIIFSGTRKNKTKQFKWIKCRYHNIYLHYNQELVKVRHGTSDAKHREY